MLQNYVILVKKPKNIRLFLNKMNY